MSVATGSALDRALEQLRVSTTQDIQVRASLETTFATLLEELGPANLGHENAPMPLVLEAWPGGRWFRDLGHGNGHLWGHVQAIKRPTLLEIWGPLMISSATVSNLQYRLKEVDDGTLIALRHSTFGLIPEGYSEELSKGLVDWLERVRRSAEGASRKDAPGESR